MIQEIYKNSPLIQIVKHYISMTDAEIDLLSYKEKELINYYKEQICNK